MKLVILQGIVIAVITWLLLSADVLFADTYQECYDEVCLHKVFPDATGQEFKIENHVACTFPPCALDNENKFQLLSLDRKGALLVLCDCLKKKPKEYFSIVGDIFNYKCAEGEQRDRAVKLCPMGKVVEKIQQQ